ncbi:MAG: MaoC family dehydratase [Sporichthyaceae bacterium]
MPTAPSNVLHLADLKDHLGKHLGYSEWHTVEQDQITMFADASGDHQWIHLDAERARSGPFGATIAHGYLTLSLASKFLFELLAVDGAAAVVNYGLNKTRFPAPVRSGAALRMGAEVLAVDPVPGGVQLTITATFEVANQAKPACVAELVFRYFA